jgi:hypothetical protein
VSTGGRMAILAICDEGRVPDHQELKAAATSAVQLRTECERDILAWFLSAVPRGEKRRGEDIIKGMEKAGMLHGRRTAMNSLSRLVRLGLLRNERDKSGYALVDGEGDGSEIRR